MKKKDSGLGLRPDLVPTYPEESLIPLGYLGSFKVMTIGGGKFSVKEGRKNSETVNGYEYQRNDRSQYRSAR